MYDMEFNVWYRCYGLINLYRITDDYYLINNVGSNKISLINLSKDRRPTIIEKLKKKISSNRRIIRSIMQ